MSSASASNGPASAPTSTSSPGKPAPLPGEAAAAIGSPGSDAYLREQAKEAREALAKGFEELKVALAQTADPRVLPRKFPFVTLGVAAVGGFVAALLAIPSKEQQELRKLERIRRAMYPDPAPAREARATGEKGAEAAAAKPPLWATLLKEGVQAARPLLVSLVTAQLNAKAQPPAPPPDESATAG